MKEYTTEIGDTAETTDRLDELAIETDRRLVYLTKHDLEEMLALLEGEG